MLIVRWIPVCRSRWHWHWHCSVALSLSLTFATSITSVFCKIYCLLKEAFYQAMESDILPSITHRRYSFNKQCRLFCLHSLYPQSATGNLTTPTNDRKNEHIRYNYIDKGMNSANGKFAPHSLRHCQWD